MTRGFRDLGKQVLEVERIYGFPPVEPAEIVPLVRMDNRYPPFEARRAEELPETFHYLLETLGFEMMKDPADMNPGVGVGGYETLNRVANVAEVYALLRRQLATPMRKFLQSRQPLNHTGEGDRTVVSHLHRKSKLAGVRDEPEVVPLSRANDPEILAAGAAVQITKRLIRFLDSVRIWTPLPFGLVKHCFLAYAKLKPGQLTG